MKKILLSLLIAGGVQYSFAMQGSCGSGAAAQGGAAQSTLSAVDRQLIEAVKEGNVAAVRALLESGADVNAQLAGDWTTLMHAARAGHVEVVRLLIEKGANVNAQYPHNWTALMHAANYGHVEVVRVLLASGADVNTQNADGSKALMIAAKNGHAEVVRALLAGGADVNSQTANGSTALMYAAQNERIEVVKVLLDSNADVNEQNAHGWTALMNAAFYGHVDFTGVIRELLEQSADVNLQNTDGRKAIDYAHGKKKEMILLNAQADKVSSEPKISNRQPAPSSASASRAASGSTARASADGGVTRTVGGAGQTVDKTLCTEVSAKILADAVSQTDDLGSQSAGTQTEPIQVGPSQATAQERLSSRLKSAFSKPRLSEKPSSTSEMDCDEAIASGSIVVPIAVRPGAIGVTGLQQLSALVDVPQVFSLQPLILEARANGTGLSGLIQLLNRSEHDAFNAFEAEVLVAGLGFNALIFEQAHYNPITGLELALLLTNRISSILGLEDAASVLTEDQATNFKILETLFEHLP